MASLQEAHHFYKSNKNKNMLTEEEESLFTKKEQHTEKEASRDLLMRLTRSTWQGEYNRSMDNLLINETPASGR